MAISLSITPLITPFVDGMGAYLFYYGVLTGDASGGDVTFLLNMPAKYNGDHYLAIDYWAFYASGADNVGNLVITGAALPEVGLAGSYTFATYLDNPSMKDSIRYIKWPERLVYLGQLGTANVATWGNMIINTNTNLSTNAVWLRARIYSKPLKP